MRGLIIMLVLGFVGIKGLVWVVHDTALAVASRHWVTGEAVIDHAWLERMYGKNCWPCYSLRTAYHFSVGGARHEGDRFEIPPRRSEGDESYFRGKLAPYAAGNTVKILYDPKDPTLSVVTPPHVNYFFTIGLGGLALLISGFAVWRAYVVLSRLIRADRLAHAM